MTTNRERAEQLLGYYMRTVWKAAGLQWDSDHETEMGMLVDLFHGIVVDEIQEHAENTPHLYRDGSR